MRRALAAAAAVLLLVGCNGQKTVETPKPFALDQQAIGHYCGMNVLEHPGPKGQVILQSRIDPMWFSSARDALAFTMLPEEPKDILAIYVSDMGKAASWDSPGAENWVDAHKAWFVVGGSAKGGMGVPEAVPFSDRAAADRFAREKGGAVVGFDDVPRDQILAAGAEAPVPDDELHSPPSHGAH
jgi:copper chaperone NosL